MNTDELSTVDCEEEVLLGVARSFIREYGRMPTIDELRFLATPDAAPG